jgi:ribosome silencing factor RsfS/YbeB/iojap
MEAEQLARLCVALAENRKGENPLVLDVRKLTSVTSYFVVVTGTSNPHLRAIRDEIETKLQEEHGLKPLSVDGELRSTWVVLDYSEVIVQIMLKDTRERYDLESLWGDAPRVRKAKQKQAAVKAPKTAKTPKAPRKKAPARPAVRKTTKQPE